uniref:HORMA domain-containing protein n=1 Tax=Steinernema glaseri TaxID=37863 RepID=A0A1I8AMK1_9BILA
MANGTRNANCGLRKFKMLIFSEAIIAYCKEMISTADFPFLTDWVGTSNACCYPLPQNTSRLASCNVLNVF